MALAYLKAPTQVETCDDVCIEFLGFMKPALESVYLPLFTDLELHTSQHASWNPEIDVRIVACFNVCGALYLLSRVSRMLIVQYSSGTSRDNLYRVRNAGVWCNSIKFVVAKKTPCANVRATLNAAAHRAAFRLGLYLLWGRRGKGCRVLSASVNT